MSSTEAWTTAERLARASYGRLVALLAASTGDLALAEDALSAAFEQALASWPTRGVPANPEAWLLTVARNRQRDTWKSAFHRTSAPLEAADAQGGGAMAALDELDVDAIGDKRLELLFTCAHPAIDPGVRTPLMLQAVLGFDAARIAAAFAVPEAAMAQRLVRAKKRIKGARIPFTVPGRDAMPGRLPTVLEAIYGCYALSFADRSDGPDGSEGPDRPDARDSRGAEGERGDLAGEAQYLAVTLAGLLRTEPEAWGLAAMITLSQARSGARGGTFVPLEEQDTSLWDARLIADGESHLRRAAAEGAAGRFQLEAAIQAVHCARAHTHRIDWPALRTLYTALVAIAPSIGARVALAAVVGRVESPAAGLAVLGGIGEGEGLAARAAVEHFQPYLATRADLLARDGQREKAAAAFSAAAGATGQPAVREYLLRRAAGLFRMGLPDEQGQG
ncbi:RNA polymerase subunit sigma-70 [Bacillus sp. SRB_336]|nr:RNA polymerase subunit sigma-70 [Bacillus sp. SRB_336]